MHLDHRTVSKFSRYLLIAIASSATVQVAELWPQMWVLIGVIAALGMAYLSMFGLRYYGLLTGKRWAHEIKIEHLDGGAIDFATFAGFIIIGGLGTWLMFSI